MKAVLFATAIGLAIASTSTLAFQCPADMGKIDAALAGNPQLNSADLAKVKDLRAKGERQHRAGQHGDSVSTLAEAKKLLGI